MPFRVAEVEVMPVAAVVIGVTLPLVVNDSVKPLGANDPVVKLYTLIK